MLTGVIYPVAAHAVWSSHGFLSAGAVDPLYGIGVIDFAGSGVIHVTGGAVAFIAAVILGPRVGRFYDSHGRPFRRPRDIPGHSVAIQLLGTFLLWFGCMSRLFFLVFNSPCFIDRVWFQPRISIVARR